MMHSPVVAQLVPIVHASIGSTMHWLALASVAVGAMWLLLRMNRQLLSWVVAGWMVVCITVLAGRVPAFQDATPLLRHTLLWVKQSLGA